MKILSLHPNTCKIKSPNLHPYIYLYRYMGIKHIAICSENRINILIGFHQENKVINKLQGCLIGTYLFGESLDGSGYLTNAFLCRIFVTSNRKFIPLGFGRSCVSPWGTYRLSRAKRKDEHGQTIKPFAFKRITLRTKQLNARKLSLNPPHPSC